MLLLFTLLLQAIFAGPVSTPCKIGFRLDDVQDGWLVDTQKQVIQAFVDRQVPITVGVITDVFGFIPTVDMVPYLNDLLKRGAPIEIASHTMNHISLGTQNLSMQTYVCSQSKAKLTSLLTNNPRPITTMICPFDSFNQDTLDAMRATGYNTISSMFDPLTATADGRTFYSTCSDALTPINGIVHTPSKAQTSTNGNGIRVATADVLAAMQTSINSCGFSVVEMHFMEFADASGKTIPSGIDDIKTIIDTTLTWGCEIQFLQDLHKPAAPVPPVVLPPPSASSTATPSSAATASPSSKTSNSSTPVSAATTKPVAPVSPNGNTRNDVTQSQPIIVLSFVALALSLFI